MLVRCGACDRLVRSNEKRCPFCDKSLRRRLVGKVTAKIAVGAIGGATALLSGIGCAYGCPTPKCGPYDSGEPQDSSSDVIESDASDAAFDALADAKLDANGEAGEAGTDASDASAD